MSSPALVPAILAVTLALLPLRAAAQTDPTVSPAPSRTLRAVRLTAPLALDGRLDEAVYASVPPTGGFTQQEPNEGEPATEETDVWVFYDDTNIYVSARCWDSEPLREIANEMRRDGNLMQNDNLVVTPHLGASTEEAQVEVAIEVVDQVMAVLNGQSAPYTVNVPFVPAAVREVVSPFIDVATTMGRLAIQLSDGQLDSVMVRVGGDIAEFDTSILASAALVGILSEISDVRVNLVNAPLIAKERGINLIQERNPETLGVYANIVGIDVRTDTGKVYLAGTSVNGRVHLLRLNDFFLDMEPNAPYMLFTSQLDQPGMIGKVGTIAGSHDANISFMEVGRDSPRGNATMIVGFDDLLSDAMLADIRAIPGMTSARWVHQELGAPIQPRLRKA